MPPSEKQKKHEVFIVDAFSSLPGRLDTAYVRSAAEYRILLHLVRSLTKYNKKAQIEGDLAKSWTISNDFRTYSFSIDPSAKWSDGSMITSLQIADSIRRQIRLNNATHFDFSDIEHIATSETHVMISLKRRNPHFLKSVAHPEFGAIRGANKGDLVASDFQIASGAYWLKTADTASYSVEKNDHHPLVGPNTISHIRFQSSPLEKQIQSLENDQVQFVVPSGPVSVETHKKLIADPNIKAFIPHVGYSYWFSLNPSSNVFSSLANRYWFQNFIHNAELDFSKVSMFWQKADQLYLPDGFGRPDSTTLSGTWSRIADSKSATPPPSLVLGVSETFIWTDAIVSKLEGAGVKVTLKKFKSSVEFEALLRARQFDAILVNNDFSDSHLVENLLVTFSKSRPLLVIEPDHHFYSDLAEAKESENDERNFAISRKIAIDFLIEGLVAPIAYNRKSFYARKSIDLSAWTELQSDLCFWKIRYAEKNADGLKR